MLFALLVNNFQLMSTVYTKASSVASARRSLSVQTRRCLVTLGLTTSNEVARSFYLFSAKQQVVQRREYFAQRPPGSDSEGLFLKTSSVAPDVVPDFVAAHVTACIDPAGSVCDCRDTRKEKSGSRGWKRAGHLRTPPARESPRDPEIKTPAKQATSLLSLTYNRNAPFSELKQSN